MKKLRNVNLIWAAGLCFLLALFLPSCMKDEIDLDKISKTVDLNPKFGAPIAYGSLSLKDLVNAVDTGGYIKEDNNGLFYLIYNKQVLSQSAASLITIPSQSFSMAQNSGVSLPIPGTSNISIPYSGSYNLTIPNGSLDSILLKAGSLILKISSQFQHTGSINITFPSLKKNGIALQIPVTIDKADGTFSNTISKDLTGYKLELGAGNKLTYSLSINLTGNNNPYLPTQQIKADIQLSGIKYSAIYGNLGSNTLLNSIDTINVGIFKNASFTGVVLKNPQLNFTVNNSFGIPVSLELKNTRIYSSNSSSILTFSPGVNPFNIKAPTLAQAGTPSTTSIKLDTTNCTLRDALSNSPKSIMYNILATTYNNNNSTNFVRDDSKLDIGVEFKIPFDLYAKNITIWDTTAFDLNSTLKDFSIIKKLILYNTFTNTIPFNLALNIQLVDKDKKMVDNLDSYNVASGTLINGVTGSSTTTDSTIFTAARAKNLKNVKFAIIKATISTRKDGNSYNYVQLLSKYRLGVAFQVQAELQINSLNQL